jgi:NADH:ubiquinone oxidoreductase subunit C
MNTLQLGEIIKSFDKDVEIRDGKQFTEVNIPASKLYQVARLLKENKETSFDFLFCITGVDYGQDLGVVYHLRSTKLNHSLVLKTRTPDREKPLLDSVADIWGTAEFHEREVFDLLGIRFSNHPDLRRFFLSSSYGFPLRKDFVDDVNVVSKK